MRESIEIEKRKIIDKVEKIEERDIIILSPNDLVYIPTKQEQENPLLLDFKILNKEQINRIYLVNDFSGSTIYFVPYHVSSAIIPKEIDLDKNETKGKLTGSFDIKTASLDGVQIKDVCWKLKVDRLGNITEVNGKPIL